MYLKKLAFLLIVFAVLFGCNSKESNESNIADEKELNYTNSEVNGVKKIHNKNTPADENFKVIPTKLFTILPEDDDILDTLRNINGIRTVRADKDNNIFILDQYNSNIKKFDEDGIYIKTIGKAGNGPGEFGRASSMCISADTVFVNDMTAQKIVKYNTNGDFLYNLLYSADLPRKIMSRGDLGYTQIILPFENVDNSTYINGALVTSNGKFEIEKRLWEKRGLLGGNNYDFHNYYPEYYVSKNKIYVDENSTDKYQINVFDIEGNKELVITKSFRKIKMDQKDLEAINANRRTANRDNQIVEANISYKKTVSDIEVDKFDRIWTKPALEARDSLLTGKVFDIFDKDGIFLNRITVDEANENSDIYFINERMYILDKDEMTVDVYSY